MSDIYERARKRRIKIEKAVKPAENEAENSGLPGVHNGPGDAYRHIIGAAEITRRFGEATARVALEGHELKGLIYGKQPLEEAAMDRHNNEIGIKIGREAGNLDEVIARAREKIDSAANGTQDKDVPRWLPQEKWKGDGTNWPPEWHKPQPGDYTLGGEEHRYPGWRGDADFDETGDPLARPVETWSEEDIAAVMNSDAYLRSSDLDHEAMHRFVYRWHEHFYGNGPTERDAQGRIIPLRPIPPNRGGGMVQVRAHDRAGGKVAVRSYERARPSA